MKALVIADMLDDFVTGALANPNAERIVEPLARLLEHARARSRTGSSSSRTTRTTRPIPNCASGASTRWRAPRAPRSSPSWSRSPAPRRSSRPSAPTAPSTARALDEQLRALGVDEVVICGQHTHICVRHSAYGALIRGYRVTIPRDCVCAFDGVDEDAALDYLVMAYGATLADVAQLTGAAVRS